jgi:hypothetical protein
MVAVEANEPNTAAGKEHLLLRLGRRLRAWHAKGRATITETGLEVAGIGAVMWQDILAIRKHKESWRAHFRLDDGEQKTAFLGGLSKGEAEQLKAAWEADLVAAIRRDGYFEGTIIRRRGDQSPGCNTVLFLILGLAALPLAWWLLNMIWSGATPWLEPAQILYYTSSFVAGAVLMIALMLLTAYHNWRELRATGSWQRWRIDRNGLSVPSPAGGWALIRIGPRDRVGDGAVVGGSPVPIGLFSGGELTSKLLIGIGQRQGAATGVSGYYRNTALRCLLLWCPLLAAGWLAFLRLTGQPVHSVHWIVLGYGGVLFGLVGFGFLWIHFRLRKHLRRLTVEAEELMVNLGW